MGLPRLRPLHRVGIRAHRHVVSDEAPITSPPHREQTGQ
jgi:hypothetical protein